MNRNITFQRQYDPFSAPEPVMFDPQGLENNLQTIQALQDPAGTLKRMQAEKILKGMADLKLDGVNQQMQGHALKQIQDYLDFSKGLYRQQKGLNRLQLNADQQLAENQRYRELLGNINAMKEISADYSSAMGKIRDDFNKNLLDHASFVELSNDLDKRFKEADDIKKMPLPTAVVANYYKDKGLDNWMKMLDEGMTTAVKNAQDRIQSGVDKGTGRTYQQAQWDPLMQVSTISANNPRIMKGIMGAFGNNKAAFEAWAKDRYGVDIFKLGGAPSESMWEKRAWWDYTHPDANQPPEPVEPVQDEQGTHWYMTSAPYKWSGQIDIPDPEHPGKTKSVAASGQSTETIQKPDGSFVHVVNVKYRNNPGGKPRETTTEVPADPSYVAKITQDRKFNPVGLKDAFDKRGTKSHSEGDISIPSGGKNIKLHSTVTYSVDDIKKIFPEVKNYSDSDIKTVFSKRGVKVQ